MTLDTVRRRARILPFLAALLLAAFSSAAFADTFITIADVPIDVTAKSAAAARDQAIAAAQAKAFARLLKQLVPNAADQARVHPSQADIEGFVQDFAVQSERTSPVRYIGRYTVRFRSNRVRQYLHDSGVASVSEPVEVVVLPLYKTASGPVLWAQGNVWRAAWDQGGFGEGPVTLILANGDAFDAGTLSPAAAETGDVGALNAIMERYHAAGIVVAEAEPRDAAKGAASGLTLTVATYDAAGPKGSQSSTVDPVPGELSGKVLRRGVTQVAEALETTWQQTIATTGSVGLHAQADIQPQLGSKPYPIAMPVAGIGDWIKARDALGVIPGVARVSLDALTRSTVAFTLDFAGDPLALQTALADSGFILVQTADATEASPGIFELRRADAAANTVVAPSPPGHQ